MHLKRLDLPWYKIEKLIQELAWRDYWQQVWIEKKEGIKQDLKNPQYPISNHQVPEAIVKAQTGIEAVDEAIEELYKTGYMHNHMRMYVASICCNIAHCHWLVPALWMHSHLLDGDLASNHLSWQWVAGAFSNKKYFANQENINTFFNSSQKNTFLDVEYSAFPDLEIPHELIPTQALDVDTILPKVPKPILENQKSTLIYNYYNLDPYWHKNDDVQRIFLLEPSFFKEHPISQKCLDFAIELSKNIEGMQLFVGEFAALQEMIDASCIVYKEHPTNGHYNGVEEPREWLSSVSGYFSSFFKFWKKCKKEL